MIKCQFSKFPVHTEQQQKDHYNSSGINYLLWRCQGFLGNVRLKQQQKQTFANVVFESKTRKNQDVLFYINKKTKFLRLRKNEEKALCNQEFP